MKIKFAEFLCEYRSAPQSQPWEKNDLENFVADENNAILLRTHASIAGKDLVIVEYKVTKNDYVFVIVNRKDKKDIAGYMSIKRFGKYWQVQDVALYDGYTDLGLGIDLYVKVINSQFDLVNGFSLSKKAEAVWRQKLIKHANVNVYDRVEDKVLPFSDLPLNDKPGPDVAQRYFYLASSKQNLPEGMNENALVDVIADIKYERWLLNDPSYNWHGFRSSKYGDVGDF